MSCMDYAFPRINRREMLEVSAAAALGTMAGCQAVRRPPPAPDLHRDVPGLLPYPQIVTHHEGALRLGPARYVPGSAQPSITVKLAQETLNSRLPRGGGGALRVRLGSVEEGYGSRMAHFSRKRVSS
jgi:hypothetical protein